MSSETSANWRAYTILALMPLFFSSNMIIGRVAVETVEPWTLAFLRWFIAFLVLWPGAHAGFRRHRAELVAEWPSIALLGFIGMWICGGIVYMSLRHTTATNGTLIYTSTPVFILLLEMVFRGQRTSLRQVVGIALAFLGVVVILMRGEPERLVSLEFNSGDLGIAFAAAAWAIYSVVLKRPALAALPTHVLFAAIALAGAVVLFPFAAWEVASLRRFPATPDAWISIAGLVLVSSVLAYSSYQYGVKTVGPTLTSIFMYLLPVYGVALAIVFLGEEVRPYHGLGFLLVMLGVVSATAPAALWRRLERSRAG